MKQRTRPIGGRGPAVSSRGEAVIAGSGGGVAGSRTVGAGSETLITRSRAAGVVPETAPVASTSPWNRLAAFLELTKPRITMLVGITGLIGFKIGASMTGGATTGLLGALVGILLVAGGANALNQFFERDVDGRMLRTAGRPLPSGRLSPGQALAFATALSAAGVVWLAWNGNALSGALAALTLTSYAFVYTPLKRITPLNTLVGAVPGAMPPVIGWVAASHALDPGAWVLFAIMFVWQLPHSLAIAWMYREDYVRAGLPMLPAIDPDGTATSRCIAATCAVLVPVGLAPTLLGISGWIYFAGAGVLGLGFLVLGLELARTRLEAHARRLFFASLIHLPVLLTLMMLDRAPA